MDNDLYSHVDTHCSVDRSIFYITHKLVPTYLRVPLSLIWASNTEAAISGKLPEIIILFFCSNETSQYKIPSHSFTK
jgi:hypothetical protein